MIFSQRRWQGVSGDDPSDKRRKATFQVREPLFKVKFLPVHVVAKALVLYVCGRNDGTSPKVVELNAGTYARKPSQIEAGDVVVLLVGGQRVPCVTPNVQAKRATTAGRQARPQENVHRTLWAGLVACRWRSA